VLLAGGAVCATTWLKNVVLVNTSSITILFSFVYQNLSMRRECQSQLNKTAEGNVISLRVLDGQSPMNWTLTVLVAVGVEMLKVKIKVKLSVCLIN
jgi:hypothetical protein